MEVLCLQVKKHTTKGDLDDEGEIFTVTPKMSKLLLLIQSLSMYDLTL